MVFDLKKTLKALLFSTSEYLSIRDIQGVIQLYHEQANVQTSGVLDPESEAVSDIENDEQQFAKIIEEVPSLLTATQIRDVMNDIACELEEMKEVYRLVQGPAGYRITIAPEYASWVRLLRNDTKPLALRRSAMETLAIVAYRQPVTRAEMEAIRGVSVESAISKLLELELVMVIGRAELPGRPIQYGVTDKFLEFVGICSIEELPASDVLTPGQISDWLRHADALKKSNINDRDMGLSDENSENNSGKTKGIVD